MFPVKHLALRVLMAITTIALAHAQCDFEYLQQPPSHTVSDCKPYSDDSVINFEMECLVRRAREVVDDYEIKWFRETPSGTVEPLDSGIPISSGNGLQRSRYHSWRLLHQEYNPSFLGTYWCQVIRSINNTPHPLKRSNGFTLLAPEQYTTPPCPITDIVKVVENRTCADLPVTAPPNTIANTDPSTTSTTVNPTTAIMDPSFDISTMNPSLSVSMDPTIPGNSIHSSHYSTVSLVTLQATSTTISIHPSITGYRTVSTALPSSTRVTSPVNTAINISSSHSAAHSEVIMSPVITQSDVTELPEITLPLKVPPSSEDHHSPAHSTSVSVPSPTATVATTPPFTHFIYALVGAMLVVLVLSVLVAVLVTLLITKGCKGRGEMSTKAANKNEVPTDTYSMYINPNYATSHTMAVQSGDYEHYYTKVISSPTYSSKLVNSPLTKENMYLAVDPSKIEHHHYTTIITR